MRCLEAFPFEIEVKEFTVHTELAGPELVDLTPFMREDILLNLPAYPHCDREGGRICPVPETSKRSRKRRSKRARPTGARSISSISDSCSCSSSSIAWKIDYEHD